MRTAMIDKAAKAARMGQRMAAAVTVMKLDADELIEAAKGVAMSPSVALENDYVTTNFAARRAITARQTTVKGGRVVVEIAVFNFDTFKTTVKRIVLNRRDLMVVTVLR